MIAADESQPPRVRASTRLREMLRELPDGEINLEWILVRLRERSFGISVLLLAVLGLLPVVSFFAGLLLIVPAVQMMFRGGRLHVWGAERVGIPTSALRRFLHLALPSIEWGERFLKPRMSWLTFWPSLALVGLVTLVMAVLLLVPLPLTNLVPALALGVMAMGLIERDGGFVLAGIGIGFTWAAILVLIFWFLAARLGIGA